MIPAEALPCASLSAPLSYRSGKRGSRWATRCRQRARRALARRSHSGPLRVQRDLYPEGPHTCHNIVLHPPGGIAGGDALAIDVALDPGSAALLTTPGAGKWYRSQGLPATQTLAFSLARGASLEWLPQETILFDGALAGMHTRVELAEDARYLGWEILCFGRTASGERYASGTLTQRTEILRGGRRLWTEQGRLDGGDALFTSPLGLAGRTVCGTLLAAGADAGNALLAALREVPAGTDALAGITRLPGVLIARWLGDSGEDARRYFAALWALLRPELRGLDAAPPRIWAT
ncbi:MAG: urease accessory protein UreD [Betaproteobacteria bacterium]|nr:urease accessory protein UreD [Betaproteobacteria bacterium]